MLDALGDYVGVRPGLVSDLLAYPPDPEADPFGAALVDDQWREIAGLGKRDWRALDAEQKAAAVTAGVARWRSSTLAPSPPCAGRTTAAARPQCASRAIYQVC